MERPSPVQMRRTRACRRARGPRPRRTATATPSASTRSPLGATASAAATCVELCPDGVHVKPEGYTFTAAAAGPPVHRPGVRRDRPLLRRPVPEEGALADAQSDRRRLGDPRWTVGPDPVDLAQAETGHAAADAIWSTAHGASGGGFDRIAFRLPASRPAGRRSKPRG